MTVSYLHDQGAGLLEGRMTGIRLVVFDFDGVFTDNKVYVDEHGVESVCCSRSDGIGIERLRLIDIDVLILSTEVNPVVSMRAKKLRTPCIQGVKDKAEALLDYCAEKGIDPAVVAFVGNDVNDIPAFRVVGFPIAVADAFPEVLPYVIYRTIARGGEGAVRELCDMIFRVKQTSLLR